MSKKILVVEDNDNDFFFICLSLENVAPTIQVDRCLDGDMVIDYLENTTKLPTIILMDYYMFHTNGLETLKKIKKHSSFSFIPVVFFTSEDSISKVRSCYAAQASGYMIKPEELVEYTHVFRVIVDYWFNTSLT